MPLLTKTQPSLSLSKSYFEASTYKLHKLNDLPLECKKSDSFSAHQKEALAYHIQTKSLARVAPEFCLQPLEEVFNAEGVIVGYTYASFQETPLEKLEAYIKSAAPLTERLKIALNLLTFLSNIEKLHLLPFDFNLESFCIKEGELFCLDPEKIYPLSIFNQKPVSEQAPWHALPAKHLTSSHSPTVQAGVFLVYAILFESHPLSGQASSLNSPATLELDAPYDSKKFLPPHEKFQQAPSALKTCFQSFLTPSGTLKSEAASLSFKENFMKALKASLNPITAPDNEKQHVTEIFKTFKEQAESTTDFEALIEIWPQKYEDFTDQFSLTIKGYALTQYKAELKEARLKYTKLCRALKRADKAFNSGEFEPAHEELFLQRVSGFLKNKLFSLSHATLERYEQAKERLLLWQHYTSASDSDKIKLWHKQRQTLSAMSLSPPVLLKRTSNLDETSLSSTQFLHKERTLNDTKKLLTDKNPPVGSIASPTVGPTTNASSRKNFFTARICCAYAENKITLLLEKHRQESTCSHLAVKLDQKPTFVVPVTQQGSLVKAIFKTSGTVKTLQLRACIVSNIKTQLLSAPHKINVLPPLVTYTLFRKKNTVHLQLQSTAALTLPPIVVKEALERPPTEFDTAPSLHQLASLKLEKGENCLAFKLTKTPPQNSFLRLFWQQPQPTDPVLVCRNLLVKDTA